MLEAQHGARREELLAKPFDDPARINFVNDDRLIKTLLLAALVPGVNSLRSLNASRLAALNHGTIRSPIPGQRGRNRPPEVQAVGGRGRRDQDRR